MSVHHENVASHQSTCTSPSTPRANNGDTNLSVAYVFPLFWVLITFQLQEIFTTRSETPCHFLSRTQMHHRRGSGRLVGLGTRALPLVLGVYPAADATRMCA